MRLRRNAARVSLLALAAALAGCAAQAVGPASSWYALHDTVPPRGDRVYICHGFGCTYREPVAFSAGDLSRLRRILAAGAKSPEAERQAISRAVQWQERRVAPIAGSQNDRGGFDPPTSEPGQLDCIDEATNTTSLLIVAERHGYLKHHRVATPVARGFFLDGRYPHATAVVAEKVGGRTYAIDSWVRANGEAPDVMPLATWFSRSPTG